MDPIEAVNAEILRVTIEIQAVVGKLENATEDKDYWRTKELQLRTEKGQLLKKEEQLREEKLIALRAGATAMAAGPGPGSTAELGDTSTAKVAKAVVKELKPMLKPVLQHVFGPRSRSSAQSEYRPAALQRYTGESQPPYATCAVSGVQLPVQDVVAGHIYQQRWPPTKDIKINDPSNILLMHRKVEQHFDNFAFTVTPVELKVVMLRKKHADKVLFEYIDDGGHQKSVKLGDLDGRLLTVAEGTAPSQYALRVHAASAFNYALQQQWCSAADIPPTVGCDRELFQGFLLDSASGSCSVGGSGGGSQDINITGEASATGEVSLSSGSNCSSAGASDKLESDLAVAAQQQLQL